MKEYKKYFEFSGTINGTNYLLRNLLSSVIAVIAGYLMGYGIAVQQLGYTALGLFLFTPTLWFNFATIYKRTSAVFPGYGTVWTIGVLICQVVSQFLRGNALYNIIQAFLIVLGLILIFNNSKIENHEG